MKKKISLIVVTLLVLVLTASFALTACGKKTENEVTWSDWTVKTEATCTTAGLKTRESSEGEIQSEAIPALGHDFVNGKCKNCGNSSSDVMLSYNLLNYGTDYVAVYEKFGSQVSINDVEQAADGRAYIYVNGDKVVAKSDDATKIELGMDFLSMAMVYNTAVPTEGKFAGKTEDDIYAQWWKLYIQRWNMLLPEVPLYSNEYYDMYNTKLGGVTEYPTNPYWAPDNALIDWTSTDGKIILGNTTELGGKFRYASFGANNPSGSDNAVAGLVAGLSTVTNNKEGGYQVDNTVVKSMDEKLNDDGTLTFTIEIKDDLKFSDGSAITAKNYLISALVFSSPVAAEAAGRDHKAGLSYVGYKSFSLYDGTNDGQEVKQPVYKKDQDGKDTTEIESYKTLGTAKKEFSGFRLLGDYKFSATVSEDYATYFYKLIYAGFTPVFKAVWLDDADIKDDGNGVYLTESFYAKADGKYAKAAHIKTSALNTDTTYPYSGAYVVESYDANEKTATLKLNTYYKGNYEGKKPTISTVVYKKLVGKTQLADFDSNGVDVIAGITGGDETNEAIAYAKGADGVLGTDDDKAIMTHYSRAGYGKLGFRADFGPVQFTAVREAIAYCLDRSDFASQFTGGYGGVVDGPYYTGAWMYKAVKDEIILSKYSKSVDSAKDVLIADGWIYDKDGKAYTSGVRYKKISAKYIDERDINYSSLDGTIKTVKLDDDTYLMPLLINWFGSVDNPFTDLLVVEMANADVFVQAGFAIKNTIGDFSALLDELYEAEVYPGAYGGVPRYTAFNFATSFSSAVYDYAYNWTIDPSMYDDYSICYVKDYADYYLIAKAE